MKKSPVSELKPESKIKYLKDIYASIKKKIEDEEAKRIFPFFL